MRLRILCEYLYTLQVVGATRGNRSCLYSSSRQRTRAFFAVVGGVIGVLSLWAMAEIQSVFIDIEENTRAAVRQLRILNGKSNEFQPCCVLSSFKRP